MRPSRRTAIDCQRHMCVSRSDRCPSTPIVHVHRGRDQMLVSYLVRRVVSWLRIKEYLVVYVFLRHRLTATRTRPRCTCQLHPADSYHICRGNSHYTRVR